MYYINSLRNSYFRLLKGLELLALQGQGQIGLGDGMGEQLIGADVLRCSLEEGEENCWDLMEEAVAVVRYLGGRTPHSFHNS